MDPITQLALLATGLLVVSAFNEITRRDSGQVVIQVAYREPRAGRPWQATWIRSPAAVRMVGEMFHVDLETWVPKVFWADEKVSSYRAFVLSRVGGERDQQAVVLCRKIGRRWTPAVVFGHGYNKPPQSVDDALVTVLRSVNAEAAYGLWPGDLVVFKFPDRSAIVRLATQASVASDSLILGNSLDTWLLAQPDPDSCFAFTVVGPPVDDSAPRLGSFVLRKTRGMFAIADTAGPNGHAIGPAIGTRISAFVSQINANRRLASGMEPTRPDSAVSNSRGILLEIQEFLWPDGAGRQWTEDDVRGIERILTERRVGEDTGGDIDAARGTDPHTPEGRAVNRIADVLWHPGNGTVEQKLAAIEVALEEVHVAPLQHTQPLLGESPPTFSVEDVLQELSDDPDTTTEEEGQH